MKKAFLFLLFTGILSAAGQFSFSQEDDASPPADDSAGYSSENQYYMDNQYDMDYSTFKNFLKEEMTDDEYKSVDSHFEGYINGLVCTYEYGEFSGDTLDDFVVLTSEETFALGKVIYVHVFKGTNEGSFEFIDKVYYPYFKTRYEVAVLIKRGVLFVTNTDMNYKNWTWNVYQIKDKSLALLNREVYQ